MCSVPAVLLYAELNVPGIHLAVIDINIHPVASGLLPAMLLEGGEIGGGQTACAGFQMGGVEPFPGVS
jgi:hypothetical protein